MHDVHRSPMDQQASTIRLAGFLAFGWMLFLRGFFLATRATFARPNHKRTASLHAGDAVDRRDVILHRVPADPKPSGDVHVVPSGIVWKFGGELSAARNSDSSC